MKVTFALNKITRQYLTIDKLPHRYDKALFELVCVGCQRPLVAKQGQKNRHHFAHKAGHIETHHCTETALHLMAKEAILDMKSLTVKPTFLRDIAINDILGLTLYQADLFSNEITLGITSAASEVAVGDIRGDVLTNVTFDGQPHTLNIEIKVSHEVDDTKRKKLEEMGLNTIEIDVKALLDEDIVTPAMLDKAIRSHENQRFIYCNQALQQAVSARFTKETQEKVSKHNSEIAAWIKDTRHSLITNGITLPEYTLKLTQIPRQYRSYESVLKKALPPIPRFDKHVEIADFTHNSNNHFSLHIKYNHTITTLSLFIEGNNFPPIPKAFLNESYLLITPDAIEVGGLPTMWGHNSKAAKFDARYRDRMEHAIAQIAKGTERKLSDSYEKLHRIEKGKLATTHPAHEALKIQYIEAYHALKMCQLHDDLLAHFQKPILAGKWLYGLEHKIWQGLLLFKLAQRSNMYFCTQDAIDILARYDITPLSPFNTLIDNKKYFLERKLPYNVPEPESVIGEYCEHLIRIGALKLFGPNTYQITMTHGESFLSAYRKHHIA